MGRLIGDRGGELSEFGKFLADELKRQAIKLKDLAERLSCEAPAVSRYMGGRRPPEKVVEEIIVALDLSDSKAERLRELSKQTYQRGGYVSSRTAGHPISMMHRRSVRQFGGFVLKSIEQQIERFGWETAPCEHDDDLAYDLKIHTPGGADSDFVLLNLLQRQYGEPERLLRLFRGQLANEPKASQILFFEPFAQCVQLLDSERSELMEATDTVSVDEWLAEETEGKGRLVHGGNWVAVLAEYLKLTPAVKAYLKAQQAKYAH
ncbi:MAG: helix-turn-helix domain-containing protein [Opitutales bacterium]